MRVLMACIPAPGTRFVEDWKAGLATHCDVIHDHREFWTDGGLFDIVHIHWPEYLSYEIEAALPGRLPGHVIQRLQERLCYWRGRGARIVAHRHNFLPHMNADPSFESLYETVYAHSDAVVHMGDFSRAEYLRRYADRFPCDMQVQSVIPHANFASYSNTVTRDVARKELGIRRASRTVLVFGGFGRPEERNLVEGAFRGLRWLNKTLLVPNWQERLRQIAWIRLKYWVRNLTRLYHRLHPWFQFGYARVADERIQYYLNAADVLFVQRWRPLNSGNLVLGFTFGRVVVGPDVGNVGEILRATANPTYDINAPESAADALQLGFRLAREGLGESNRRFALKHWDVKALADRQLALYRAIAGSHRETRM